MVVINTMFTAIVSDTCWSLFVDNSILIPYIIDIHSGHYFNFTVIYLVGAQLVAASRAWYLFIQIVDKLSIFSHSALALVQYVPQKTHKNESKEYAVPLAIFYRIIYQIISISIDQLAASTYHTHRQLCTTFTSLPTNLIITASPTPGMY